MPLGMTGIYLKYTGDLFAKPILPRDVTTMKTYDFAT